MPALERLVAFGVAYAEIAMRVFAYSVNSTPNSNCTLLTNCSVQLSECGETIVWELTSLFNASSMILRFVIVGLGAVTQ